MYEEFGRVGGSTLGSQAIKDPVANDYRPLLPQLQRDLIDQLQRELAHERSCKLALLATIEDLQTLVRTLTRERVS